jgi:hypothetical protein
LDREGIGVEIIHEHKYRDKKTYRRQYSSGRYQEPSDFQIGQQA